jgi:hypothetical protein
MTAARAARLEALGFAWETLDAAWEAQLARLAVYKNKHGDCNVPHRWAEDPQLGSWVLKQRANKKGLDRGEPCKWMTAARVAKLEALGFEWEMSVAARSKQNSERARDDAGWDAQLAKLKSYKEQHEDCNVRPGAWAEDPKLGRWVSTQRKFKKKLDRGEPSEGMTAARAARLEALGFAWETLDAAGEEKLARLAVYKAAHGDYNVSQSWSEDPGLGTWVHNQRKRKKALDRGEPSARMTAERAAKLDRLGFDWAPRRGVRYRRVTDDTDGYDDVNVVGSRMAVSLARAAASANTVRVKS